VSKILIVDDEEKLRSLLSRIIGLEGFEVLEAPNAKIALKKIEQHEIDVVIETGYEQGMIDMNRSLLELVQADEITMDNAYLYSFNPKNLERLA
jgi:DNA-binding NtrC family response regulator